MVRARNAACAARVAALAAQAEEAERTRRAAVQAELDAVLGSDSESKSVSKIHEGESQGSVKHSATGPVKPAPTVPMAALALDITAAIAKAAEAQVLKALSNLLSQVAEDYDLDFEELQGKYLGEAKPKKTRKAPVKAKVTKVEETSDEEGPLKCIALTKKGDRCKCKPRNGEVTCGRHKDYDPEAKVEEKPKKARGRPRKAKKDDTSSDSEEEVKPKRKPKAKKPAEPEHKHELDAEVGDCEACKEQGPPFQLRSGRSYKAPDEDEIRRRLAALDDDSDAETQEDKPEGQGADSDFDIQA